MNHDAEEGMMRWRSRYRGVGVALLAFAAWPGTASGAGIPVSTSASTGVTSLDGELRYATVGASGGTVALRVETVGGEVDRSTYLDEAFGVPAVAADGTSGGLSGDGRTLVLTQPRRDFPQHASAFAVLDAERLKVRDEITLQGDFSFDAISPDGRLMYLIRYTDRRDTTDYEVRAYDAVEGRLLPDPIVDPDEPDEAMTGWPLTRAVSPDGRWAYTLYNSFERGHPPFIHALDTEGATAQCIDLDTLSYGDDRLWRLNLEPSPDGATLDVTERGDAVLSVDLASFEVTEPVEDAAASSPSGDPQYAAIAFGAVAIAALLLVGRHRWRNGA
jgi:hypothetical protein